MRLRFCKAVLSVLALAAVVSVSAVRAAGQQRLAGVVVDSSGAVVAGAELVLTGPGYRASQTSSREGKFIFDAVPITRGRLHIAAQGFAEQEQYWRATAQPLQITLMPARVAQRVTVTATRTETRLSDTAASVVLLDQRDIETAGAVTLDDALRQVPGLTLFRRSGSLAANPTSQGVSLRGLGASGASRALVLYDGVPLNDPFGGWVYWDRVPGTAIAGVEVLRGGASDLYGTGAMGGVVDVLPRRPETSALTVESFLGNHLTPEGSLFASQRVNNWALTAAGDAFRTNGYLLVNGHDRGAVDTPATVDHRTGRLGVERIFSNGGRAFVSGSLFREGRTNSTVAQINNTRLGEIVTGADWISQRAGTFTVRLYGSGQRFFQTFSSIAANRNSESLIRTQISPAQREGISAYWSRPVKSAHTLVAGMESQDVRGHSDETVITAGTPSSIQDSGGRQRVTGVFLEDIYRLGTNWVLTGGVRIDAWRNFDAFSHTIPLHGGAPTLTALGERSETAFSPRISLLRRVNSHLSLAGSAYRAFRAPTLNELYRSFRVGNRLTQANNQLRAERLTGGEASGIFNAAGGRLALRATVFVGDVTRPVANVTLSSTPALITQQRQNLGRTGARGLELQGEARVSSSFTLSAGYQFVSATVLDFSASRALEGLALPQTPRHQFSLQARYFNPRWLLFSAQARYVGIQFDDDQNLLPLDRFFTVDAYASHALNRHLEVFAAAENLFGQRYMVGRTPTASWGPPVLARVGVKVEVGER